ncbi:Respiratory supercomplex factor 1, mitochondrial [Podila epicladia]|uniref:Respiratory supercomplex factor 1, mitochondrial n=1 Tax=Podila minutissima TaxID=64525 RepID=A0A9P5SDU4_9FUNG|nr:Respiratory supercomplex factor 1, mitochondrial [Podila minutissima]KAG0082693.1 Respiratory supercomplex factor 1, mitochondrial [Podila epicladia]KAG0097501.1 Respiratory supercomplex factor 1, mitochondrial [Podila epicladia]
MSDDQYYDEETETALDKVKRLFVENKVVSAGVGLTIAAFVGASYGVRTGRREFAQHMFRARVGFQFFTLAALLGGGMFYDKKRKEERLAIEQSRIEQSRMVALEDDKNV